LPLDDFAAKIPETGGVRDVQEFNGRSDASDIKFQMRHSKGQELYVRVVKNNMGYGNYEFVNLRKSFQDMIRRLSEIDGQNLPYEQKIEAYKGVIEAFNYIGSTVYMSAVQEPLFSIPVEKLW
jgi:hypothetical protein